MATLAQVDLTRDAALFGLPMPLTLRPPAAMTDEELITFSRRNRPYRIERNAKGELEIMSPTGSEGSYYEAYVIKALGVWAEAYGGVYFSSNGGFTLPDNAMRSPDASWVDQARWNQLSDADKARYAPLCPDFLVEILSESDSRSQLQEKMEMWIANGAKLAWMIDPFAADLTIYEPGQAPRRTIRPHWVEAETVVPGFRLDTSRLWQK